MGAFAPRSVNFLGSLRNFITSFNSSAASGTPATSSNLVSTSSIVTNLALFFPKPKALEASLEVLLSIKTIAITKIKKRPTEANELAVEDSFRLLLIVKSILFSEAFSITN